mgnify:CR=1 FL=1
MSESEKYILFIAAGVLIFIIILLSKYRNAKTYKPTTLNVVGAILVFTALFLAEYSLLGYGIMGLGILFALIDLYSSKK